MRLFIYSVLLSLFAIPALPSFASPSPSPSGRSVKEDEAWFNKQAQIFYGNHIEYIKKVKAEKKNLQKQIAGLYQKRNAAAGNEEKQKIDGELKPLQQRLTILHEEIAKHDVDIAEFGLIAAQRRLEIAKKNLEKIQANRQKKT